MNGAATVRRYRVVGYVQGVSFRVNACRAARALGLDGYVRNLADGSVEAVATGPEAALAEFERWLAVGPALARVERVEVAAAADVVPAGGGFVVR